MFIKHNTYNNILNITELIHDKKLYSITD